jgi:hypothetical protein
MGLDMEHVLTCSEDCLDVAQVARGKWNSRKARLELPPATVWIPKLCLLENKGSGLEVSEVGYPLFCKVCSDVMTTDKGGSQAGARRPNLATEHALPGGGNLRPVLSFRRRDPRPG